jgi:repressor LexA
MEVIKMAPLDRGQHTKYEMKLRKSIATNLRALLKERKMTQKQLSELTGIPTSTISDYLNEKSLALPGNIQKIADALGVHKSDIDPSFVSDSDFEDVVRLPIVGRISCGNGNVAFEDIEGYEETPRSWLTSGEYFYLRAKGDSMIGARIQDGDLLLIRKQPIVEDGEIAAVLIGDDAILKRVFKRDGILILQSENPNYPPIICDPKNNPDGVRIIGKLKKVVIDF